MGRKKIEMPTNDRSGQKINQWTLNKVVFAKRYETKKLQGRVGTTTVWYYECQCECGSVCVVSLPDIMSNKSKRCKSCSIKMHILNSQNGVSKFGKENSNYKGTADVPRRWFSRTKTNAEMRNLKFEITIEDMQLQWEVQKGLCFYSGIPLQFTTDRYLDNSRHLSVTASLDRVDSYVGYDRRNIVWVSKTINRSKMDLPHEIFLKMCEVIYIFNRETI